MNKIEYKSLEISEAEIGAIRRYISPAHISMNALLDIDPKVINKQQSKGWFIDLAKDRIEKNIEYLTKLYSAMYKYNLQAGGRNLVVYRGTSRDEVAKLRTEGISERFLSTSTDKNVAMRFTEYRNGALFTISLGDVPYISTDEFLDDTQISESEILVAPFSRIEELSSYSIQGVEGVEQYGASIKKQEFNNITEEAKKEYEDIIYSFEYKENLKRYKELSGKIEIMAERISRLRGAKTKDELEELQYLRKNQSQLYDELIKLSESFKKVKQSMTTVLQDRFKTVELEIQRGVEKEKKEIEEQERKRKIDEERKRKAQLLKNADETLERIESAGKRYETMDEEGELYTKAQELGLDTSRIQLAEATVIAKFEELKRNIEDIKKEIQDIQISDDLTKEDMSVKSELNERINTLYDKLAITNRVMDECEKTISTIKLKNKNILDKELATKLGQDIMNKARTDLLLEEQSLMQKKDSLWDKITGKSKLRVAQVENLRLRRQYVERGGLNIPNSMEEMTEYVAKYRQVLGDEKLPDTLRKVLPDLKIDWVLTNEERERLEVLRISATLIPMVSSKKQTLSVLNAQNEILKEKIEDIRQEKTENITDNLEFMIKNSVERCLDTALFYTADLTEEQKEKITKDRITLW